MLLSPQLLLSLFYPLRTFCFVIVPKVVFSSPTYMHAMYEIIPISTQIRWVLLLLLSSKCLCLSMKRAPSFWVPILFFLMSIINDAASPHYDPGLGWNNFLWKLNVNVSFIFISFHCCCVEAWYDTVTQELTMLLDWSQTHSNPPVSIFHVLGLQEPLCLAKFPKFWNCLCFIASMTLSTNWPFL